MQKDSDCNCNEYAELLKENFSFVLTDKYLSNSGNIDYEWQKIELDRIQKCTNKCIYMYGTSSNLTLLS